MHANVLLGIEFVAREVVVETGGAMCLLGAYSEGTANLQVEMGSTKTDDRPSSIASCMH